MLEAAIVLLLVGFPLVGFVARSWAAVALPIVGWPLFYLGLNRGWWLDGTGDGWERIAVAFTCVGIATTVLAIQLSSRYHQRLRRGAM